MIEGVTVDVTCCRGQRRSRLLRAAEIGDILRRGGVLKSVDAAKVWVMMGIDVLRERYGARVAPFHRPNSTPKVLSRTTPPTCFYCKHAS